MLLRYSETWFTKRFRAWDCLSKCKSFKIHIYHIITSNSRPRSPLWISRSQPHFRLAKRMFWSCKPGSSWNTFFSAGFPKSYCHINSSSSLTILWSSCWQFAETHGSWILCSSRSFQYSPMIAATTLSLVLFQLQQLSEAHMCSTGSALKTVDASQQVGLPRMQLHDRQLLYCYNPPGSRESSNRTP